VSEAARTSGDRVARSAEAASGADRAARSADAPSKTVAEMIGEALREAGLLTAVFGWLDRTIQGEPFWGPWGWTVMGLSLALFVGGAVIEVVRSPPEE
jgi:hypothetical protein